MSIKSVSYFVIVTEWNYPTESGRDTMSSTFESSELTEAQEFTKELCVNEMMNFFDATKLDCNKPNMTKDGLCYFIDPKTDDDPYYFRARIIPIFEMDMFA